MVVIKEGTMVMNTLPDGSPDWANPKRVKEVALLFDGPAPGEWVPVVVFEGSEDDPVLAEGLYAAFAHGDISLYTGPDEGGHG